MIGKKEKIILAIFALIFLILLIKNGYGIKLVIVSFLLYIAYHYKKMRY